MAAIIEKNPSPPRGLRRDYAVTFGSEMLILAGAVALFKVAAWYWGVDGFAEFSLARRVGNLLQLPLAVGVGVSLARYVSIASAENRPADQGGYLAAGLLVGLLPALLFNLLIAVAGAPLAQLLFSDPAYRADLAALGVLILGLNFHSTVYGYLRGLLKMPQANALQVVNKAVIPLAVFLRPGLTVDQVFRQVGWGQIAASALALAALLILDRPRPWGLAGWRDRLRELLRFGGVRVPGEFALTGLLGLPAVFIAHGSDVRTAGLFAFSLALLVMVGAVFAPLGLVMLPQLSSLQARGQVDRIPRIVGRALLAALVLSTAGAIAFHFLGDLAIRLYLGQGYEAAAGLARTVLWAAVPYSVYIVLRNALDALHVRPYNTKNLVIALALLVAAQPFVSGALQQARVILGVMTVLGALSYLDYRRLLAQLRKPVS